MAAKTDAPTTPPTVEAWLFLGVRHTGDGKLIEEWRDEGGNVLSFSKLGKHTLPGSYYRVNVWRVEDHCKAGSPSFLKRLEDDGERAGLIAQHRAAEVEADAFKLAQKGLKDDLDGLTLSEIRIQLRRMPATRKRAMLAIVLDRLLVGSVI